MAKSDSMKKEINKFLYFYRFLATVKIMKSVHDIEFKQYGRVLDVDTAEFVATMKAKEAIKEGVVYEPSDADLEALPLFKQMQDEVYGGLEVEFGFAVAITIN